MTRAILLAVIAVLALTAVPATAATSADQQLAEAGVLQLSDFPSGWQASARPADSDNAVSKPAAKIASCKAFIAFSKANAKHTRARSAKFDLGHSTVTNAVTVYPTMADAEVTVTMFRNAKLPQCLEQLFTGVFTRELRKDKDLGKALKSVSADISRLHGVRIGDDAVGYQGRVDVGLKDGTTQTTTLGFVTVRVGTAVVGYSYTTDTGISTALQPAVVASVSRLQRAASPA